MTTLDGRPTQTDPGPGRVPQNPTTTPLPTRQRNRGFTALAVAVIVGLAALGAWLYSSAGQKTPVVMVVREVAAGQVISRSDLTTVPVAGAVVALGAKRLPSLVGQRAAVTLLPNMLLQRSMIATGPAIVVGQAQVGVAVRSGQIPADGLVPGDVVRIIQLAGKDTPQAGPTVLVDRAVVFSSRLDPALSGGTLLTLVVPDAASTAVASGGAAASLALVKVAS